MLEDRGAWSIEEGDLIREYEATHGNISQQLVGGGCGGKAEQMEKVNREAQEEECKSGQREFEGEKGKGGCGL